MSYMDLINRFLVWIDTIIYRLVGWLYQIYLAVSSARIVRNDIFELFVQRIYVVLGIAMLFFLAYSVLLLIVDPDKISNNGGYSMSKIVFNTIISIVIIAVVPTCFNLIYQAQEILLTQNIIGKIILGGTSSTGSTLRVKFNDDDCQNLSTIDPAGTLEGCDVIYEGDEDHLSVELAGNSIALDVFSSFIYPNVITSAEDDGSQATQEEYYSKVYTYQELEDSGLEFSNQDEFLFKKIEGYNNCHDRLGDTSNAGSTLQASYIYGSAAASCAMDMLVLHESDNVEEMGIEFKSILQYAKTTGDFSGFSLIATTIDSGDTIYNGIVSIIAGGFLCYVFVSYCLDMGLRAVKLSFAQLIAPVPVFARIIPKQSDMFGRWIKFTTSAFFEVFLRLVVIFFGIFLISNLPLNTQLWENSILEFVIPTMSVKMPFVGQIASIFEVVNFARAIVIIGILMFVKQAPNIIQESLGIHANIGGLSIKNKLDGMLGMQTLKKVGGAAVGAAVGAVTGGIGAGFMAKRSGAKFWASALQGGRDGMKSGGRQFKNQYDKTWRALTGNTGTASIWTGKADLKTRINNKIDGMNKANNTYYVDSAKRFIEDFEKAFLEPLLKKMENYKKQVENSVAFKNDAIAEQKRVLEQYKDNEGATIAARKLKYESSEEYRQIQSMVRGYALKEVREEAARNGEKLNMMQESQRAEAKVEKRMLDAIKSYNSDAARQYVKDIQREHTAIEDAKRQAEENVRKAYMEKDAKYRKSIDFAVDAEKALEREIQELRKQIKANPIGREQKEYVEKLDLLEKYGKLDNNKRAKDAFNILNELYNNPNNKK